jgi:hypothetical protein
MAPAEMIRRDLAAQSERSGGKWGGIIPAPRQMRQWQRLPQNGVKAITAIKATNAILPNSRRPTASRHTSKPAPAA